MDKAEDRLSGATLGGYLIESELARGGMGVVYRARDVALKRAVALKVIAPNLAADPTFRERFRRESQLAAQIEHPAVVPVYRAGRGRGPALHRYATDRGNRPRLDPARGGAAGSAGGAARVIAAIAPVPDAAHRVVVDRDV